jgi:integrase
VKKRIVEATIRALKPPAQDSLIVRDLEIPGFGCRVTANGVVSFLLEYSFDGRQRRYTFARWPDLSATAARERVRKLRGEIAHGIDPAAEREERRTAPTVAELADRYLEDARAHKRTKSIYDDERRLQAIVLPALGKLKVAAVTRNDVEKLHRSLRATPYQGNRVLALLSAMFNRAIEWHLRTDNPCKGVKRYHEDRRETWLKTEEIARLNAALDAHADQTVAAAIKLALLTGARRGEVLGAKWSDLDFDRKVWTKPSHQTKQKKIEHVPLNPAAVALLHNLRARSTSDYLFPGRRPGEPLGDIKKSWARIRKAAGLGQVRLHDLRHTYASHLVSRGVSLHIVGKLLGHARAETTQRYAHLADEALREATGQFGALIEKLEEKRPPAEVIALPAPVRARK